jgi:hypothetical protein
MAYHNKFFPGTAPPASMAGGPGAAGSAQDAAPAGAPGGAAKLQARVFGDVPGTMAWMELFDRYFQQRKPNGVTARGKQYSDTRFRQQFVEAVGTQVRIAIGVVEKMNTGSLKEGPHLDDATCDDVRNRVAISQDKLARSGKALTDGHYVAAYRSFLGGLNAGMEACAIIGAFEQKTIDDATRMVTILEIVRDSGFVALAVLAPTAGAVALIGVAGTLIGVIDDKLGGEPVSLVAVALSIVFTLLQVKYAAQLKKLIGPPAESLVKSLLEKTPVAPDVLAKVVTRIGENLIREVPNIAGTVVTAAAKSLELQLRSPTATYDQLLPHVCQAIANPGFLATYITKDMVARILQEVAKHAK